MAKPGLGGLTTVLIFAAVVLLGLCLATDLAGMAHEQAEQAQHGWGPMPPTPVLATVRASRLLGVWFVLAGAVGLAIGLSRLH